MTFARTLSGELVALDPTVIDAFAGRVAGRVLVESAVEYEQARGVWNGLIDKRPAVVVRCLGVADVSYARRFARDHNLLVAVRGGGHNVAGSAPGTAASLSTSRRSAGSGSIPQSERSARREGHTWADLVARIRPLSPP